MKKLFFKIKVVLIILFSNDKFLISRTKDNRPKNFYEL